jgi:hypothetical protein
MLRAIARMNRVLQIVTEKTTPEKDVHVLTGVSCLWPAPSAQGFRLAGGMAFDEGTDI